MRDCKPIVSRKFIKIGGTQFEVLLADGSVKDLRDLETFHGEHIMSGTECTTSNLLNFLESWGAFDNTGSSVYIKTTNTVIPDNDTGIGDIPLTESLIITYRVGEQILIWVHTKSGTIYKYRDYVWSVDNLNPLDYISTNDIGTVVPGLDDNGILDPSVLPLLPQEIIYGFDLTALQNLPEKHPNILYIDLNTRIQYYWNGSDFAPYTTLIDFADKNEAEAGIIIAKVMSPKTTKDAINYHKATSNIIGSANLTNLTTSNTGASNKVARQDHSHKITGFALTNHTHSRVLSREPDTGRIVDMDSRTVIDIDATTLGGWNRNNFATITQGNKADTSIQDVTIGGFSYKNGTTAILPRYPVNSDFKIVHLADFPENIVENKVLVTNIDGGFEFKDYVSTFNYENATNVPSISLDSINPTQLSSTPYTLKGNLKLHPIVTSGTINVLNDVNIDTLEENNILQYKGGFWVNTPLESSLGNLSNLTFNNLGTGVTPDSSYNGSSAVTLSYNSIGAAPISHGHAFSTLTDVLLTNLETNNTLSYNGSKWINIPKYQPSNLTFNNSGSGAVSGTVYNGNTNLSISYNTIGAAASSHSHLLDDLEDVNINDPVEGELLTYVNNEWVNKPIADEKSLNDLTDVVITNSQVDQTLVYNGTNWVNSTVSGGSSTFIYDMAFVDKDGNDSTAQIGNINKPFATIQGAINKMELAGTDDYNLCIMSNLTISQPIIIATRRVVINLYNGVILTFTNNTNTSSLFNLISGNEFVHIDIVSNGSATINCNEGTYLSSFLTLGDSANTYNIRAKLENINVNHYTTSSAGDKATIFCNPGTLLEINNCHIHTYNAAQNVTLNCSNIKCSGNHIINIEDSKLTLQNYANGGTSKHINDDNAPTKTTLINCRTIQILPNFAFIVKKTDPPISDPTQANAWEDISVMGYTSADSKQVNYTISNCIFYINTTKQSRVSTAWERVFAWPKSNYNSIDLYVYSIANVIKIAKTDNLEYLGTSLHNYGNTFANVDSGATNPNEYGGTYTTSLVRCALNQPYEIY